MSIFAFIYPGQGAQKPGMGRALFEAYPAARDAFGTAGEVWEKDVLTLCFDTEPEKLNQTVNAQMALFAVSMAAHAVLAAEGITPGAVAGFSLGECCALCAAGVLTWRDGLLLVKYRAQSMQEAAERTGGAMSAVLGLSWDEVKDVCRQVSGFVEPVNDNCPGQTVIAGEPDAVAQAEANCLSAGASRAVRLPLSAAFHTHSMKQAAQTLQQAVQTLAFSPARLPLYTNITGTVLPENADMPVHMATQMQNPVRFQTCVQSILSAGFSHFVEVGEGKTLSGFVRRIDRNAKTYQTETPEQIQKIQDINAEK